MGASRCLVALDQKSEMVMGLKGPCLNIQSLKC
jgi:hypothetical protein